jgi:hypothetical protein
MKWQRLRNFLFLNFNMCKILKKILFFMTDNNDVSLIWM